MKHFVRAQALEIPSGRELPALSASMGAKINQALAAKNNAVVEQTSIDMSYFSDIQNQLSRLKDVLKAKRDDAAHTRTLIRDEIGESEMKRFNLPFSWDLLFLASRRFPKFAS